MLTDLASQHSQTNVLTYFRVYNLSSLNSYLWFFTFIDAVSTVKLLQTSRQSSKAEVAEIMEGIHESDKLCELTYGSYCLWRKEHKEKMKDFVVKRMKDQLYVARAYYPSIAKLPALDMLSQELKQNIQEYERVLSETTTDTDLPSQ